MDRNGNLTSALAGCRGACLERVYLEVHGTWELFITGVINLTYNLGTP